MRFINLVRHSSVRNALVITALFMGGISTASAADMGEPTAELAAVDGAALEALEVSRVQPVVMADSSTDVLVSATFARAAKADAGVLTGEDFGATTAALVGFEVPEEEGLDFAGASGEVDIVALQYGSVLGVVPLAAALDADKRAKMIAQVKKFAKLNTLFGPKTQRAITAYITSVEKGTASHTSYINLMRAVSQDLAGAGDPSLERRHGYLLVGLWSGLAQLTAEVGKNSRDLAATGDILISLLEKDASFGGSDRALAAQVRIVNAELRKDVASKKVVREALKTMAAVKQDA